MVINSQSLGEKNPLRHACAWESLFPERSEPLP